MADALKHIDVTAGRITEDQYEAETQHELESGVDGEFIYWDAASGSFKRIAHQTDLDAHNYNFAQKLRTGEYFSPEPYRASRIDLALTALTIYARPLLIPRLLTIDRLAIQVILAGAGGTVARLGIYNDGADLYPGTLVLDAGTVAVDGVAIVAATINQQLDKGLYWLVVVSDGVPRLVIRFPTYPVLGVWSGSFQAGASLTGWQNAAVGIGALADPFGAGAAVSTDNSWAIMPRLLTLD